MNKVLYLVHTTVSNPANYSELRKATDIENQFPGVYLTLITEDNVDKEQLYPGKYILLFSPKLLLQRNYHINITDHNGFVSEHNTYFPWELQKAVGRIKQYSEDETATKSNEVVFHDNIPTTFLCQIIKKPSFLNNTEAYFNFKLPKQICNIAVEPDLTKLPFFVYSFEHRYTGKDPLPPSSLAFFKKIAKLARLNPVPTSQSSIIEALEDKAPYLLEHRDEQNMNALRNNTQNTRNNKKNKNERKTSRANKK